MHCCNCSFVYYVFSISRLARVKTNTIAEKYDDKNTHIQHSHLRGEVLLTVIGNSNCTVVIITMKDVL